MMLYTPVQRAARLICGYDLERLYVMCDGKRMISTRKVIKEAERLSELLCKHGIEMRRLYDETRK